jgi:RNA recognition motif-containing protein
MSTKLYVGNLSWQTTRDDLYQMFGAFGNVEDAFIPMDRETGRPRGFGFVTMPCDQASAAVQGLNETEQMVRDVGGPCDQVEHLHI